jgi:hypothetical protein
VVDGASETTLDVDWDTLATQAGSEPLAINLHKSQTELSSYIACGNIQVSSDTEEDTRTE